MEFSHSDRTSHARPLVFRTHRDDLAAVTADLPEVARVEQRARAVHAGGRIELVHRWQGTQAALPIFLRPFVPEDMLVWTQRTMWDPHNWRADWDIEVPGLGAAIACSGSNVYLETGTGTQIDVSGTFAFRPDRVPQLDRIPAAAIPMVERAVVGLIVPLIERSGAAVATYLDQRP